MKSFCVINAEMVQNHIYEREKSRHLPTIK